MNISYRTAIVVLLVSSCSQTDKALDSQVIAKTKFNMTPEMVTELSWINEPQSFVTENNSLSISVAEGTDYFNNPEDSSIVGSAPYIYKEVKGDFVAKALVQPDFSAQWNALAMMVYIDSLNWIKFAFENSDATGPGIVSVVTKGSSDDANGVVLPEETMIWLAMARKGNIYSMHWSVDGKDFKMARLTSMRNQNPVKIGIEAQSPVGDGATHQVHYFEVREETAEDLRKITLK